ncbi:hypothetical protein [Croceiramulus getboli]|nr:hypothetical protein P8624_06620 [Flavobacteriaceae bacterium YJPT1-3]
MRLIGKEYRNLKPVRSKQIDDVQGTLYDDSLHYYFLILDNIHCARYASTARGEKDEMIFGRIPKDKHKRKIDNLRKLVPNDPVTVGTYSIQGKTLKAEWRFHENTKVNFIGFIINDGLAIKGTFYLNEEVSLEEQLYFDVMQTLPENGTLDEL